MNKLLWANIGIATGLFLLTTFTSPYVILLLKGIMPSAITLAALSPEAGLMAMVAAGFAMMFMLYMPILILSIYYYVRPALHEHEVRFMHNTVFLAIALFYTGVAFGAFCFMEFGVPFFLWANQLIGITSMWSISALVSQLLLASMLVGVAFLFPIVVHNIIRFGLVSVEKLKKNRIPIALIMLAIIIIVPILPNTPLEWIFVWIPLYGMFEAALWFNRQKAHSYAGVPA